MLAVLWATGCGAMRPPLEFAPADATPPAPLTIAAVEGRPDALLLRVEAAQSAEPAAGWTGHWLVIARQTGQAPAQVLQRVELTGEIARRLVGGGLEILDRGLPDQPTRLRYGVRIEAPVTDERPARVVAESAAAALAWRPALAAPTGVQATSHLPGSVELSWQASADADGAVVFRRDVLAADGRPERIAELGASARGSFVDRRLRPGGVYAYRIAQARRVDGVVLYGRPSGEHFVTVAVATAP